MFPLKNDVEEESVRLNFVLFLQIILEVRGGVPFFPRWRGGRRSFDLDLSAPTSGYSEEMRFRIRPFLSEKLGWWKGACFSSLAFLVKNINKRAALLVPLFHKKSENRVKTGENWETFLRGGDNVL